MDGLELIASNHSQDDARQKYIQSVNVHPSKAEHAEVVEQMTRVNQELAALLFLISSKGNVTNLSSISKKGNLLDFKG